MEVTRFVTEVKEPPPSFLPPQGPEQRVELGLTLQPITGVPSKGTEMHGVPQVSWFWGTGAFSTKAATHQEDPHT